MSHVTFNRINPHESRIYSEADYVGDVYRHHDILKPAAHYYVIHLDEDYRGPVRVHERSRIREVTEQRIRTRPFYG